MRTRRRTPSGDATAVSPRCAATAVPIASRAREGDEERVALGADLAAAVGADRLPKHALVGSEQLGVAVAEGGEQSR
jgi:hypothetical protein